jgi:hypothetical protein
VPVAHSTSLKENYVNLEMVLEKIKYYEHNWSVCTGPKLCGILLGKQGGYTKFPCFMCEWDSRSREKHWVVQSWPQRIYLEVGTKNTISPSLINPQKILLPPLHIELGIMKQSVKVLDKNGPCFQYLTQKFPLLSTTKVKEGLFDCPQIRKFNKDSAFRRTMTDLELQAWENFKEVMITFL